MAVDQTSEMFFLSTVPRLTDLSINFKENINSIVLHRQKVFHFMCDWHYVVQ